MSGVKSVTVNFGSEILQVDVNMSQVTIDNEFHPWYIGS